VNSQDIYAEVTDRMIAELEQGRVPWSEPWRSEVGQPRSIDNRPYRGINALLLGMSDYDDPRWGTFKAIQRHGGHVRKGERSTVVVLWKPFTKRDAESGEQSRGLMLRYFRVFNVEQADGLDLMPLDKLPNLEPDAISNVAHEVFTNYADGPVLHYGGDHAFYATIDDAVTLPDEASFTSTQAFATTLFHELTHSTGHKSRLNRDEVGSGRFGSETYGKEELIAEMGAGMIAASVGIDPDYPQSAAYLRSWLEALKDDKRLLVSAAARAQKAADHVLGIEPPTIKDGS